MVGPSGRLVDLVPTDFEQKGEPWVSVELEDGTLLKMKLVVTGVSRLEGERDSVGNPAYLVNREIIIRVVRAGKGLRGESTFGVPIKKTANTDDAATGYR